ncbi:DUF2149 domain-containing protein [Blautia sp. HCP28S3_G10]|uniref:DUF2149 domain-containing protein n=1 Tax=Blautia sp. HCP28S3_G10 TaxID=3438908 RepID=UPI003F891F1B
MKNSRLKRRGGSSFFEEEEQNPMGGVANLVDAMLVLACGLMMAIISFYNVDIKGTASRTEELKQEQLQEVDDYGVIDDEGNVSGGFESRGKVYEDKKTGKLYVVTEDTTDETGADTSDQSEQK